MTTLKITLKSLSDTDELAKIIASYCVVGDSVFLYGDLSSGKTTFAQYFISFMSKKKAVVGSPTFNLVNVYDANICKVYHYDLYRLKNNQELFELALEDALRDGITLIEWPERMENIRLKNKVAIYFKCADNGSDNRVVAVKLFGKFEHDKGLLTKLKNYTHARK